VCKILGESVLLIRVEHNLQATTVDFTTVLVHIRDNDLCQLDKLATFIDNWLNS